MESLLYQLINHIKDGMPSLSLVDEDYGQLEAIDKEDMDTYPVTFPCVLILAHRKIAANRLAIDCIYALSKEELSKVDRELEGIAMVLPRQSKGIHI